MTTWINPKTAAAMAGLKGASAAKTFLAEWIPEVGEPQVRFRNPNGKTGKGRRPEVDLEDLESVLESRTSKRAG